MKNKYLILSLLPFLICAFFSDGFLHPDEHYQILELLNLKISNIHKDEIFNWDFHLKMRSWFQVFIYFLIAKISFVKNPFTLACILRMFTGLLGWAALFLLCKGEQSDQKEGQNALTFAAWIWFVPFLLVRTSSEAMSSSFFLIGASFFLKEGRKDSLLSGFFWGISFLCRFQMGIPIMVGNLWNLHLKKNWKGLILHSTALMVMIAFGVLVDRWGYGEWCFTPFNYLKYNVFESRASEFGISPFWFYFTTPLIKGGLPLALLLALGCVLYWKRNLTSFWAVVSLAFLLVHIVIPHKEVRFLTFVYILAPYFLYQSVPKLGRLWKMWWKVALATNLVLLLKVFFTPAHSPINFYRFIYAGPESVYYTPLQADGSYYKLTMPFYEGRKVETKGTNIMMKGKYITSTYKEYELFSKNNFCHSTYSNYSDWVLQKNFFNWRDRSAILNVWSCDES